ncbi:MAG: hypothetical protein IKK58_03200 [Clostridia bacterium]|nr:hypothetical protein [Clostridia bacterium]
MNKLNMLITEMNSIDFTNRDDITAYLAYMGYREHYAESSLIARAYATANLFKDHKPFIYNYDRILGSINGRYAPCGAYSQATLQHAANVCASYGYMGFYQNIDHFTPDYPTLLQYGIGGMLNRIDASEAAHKGDSDAAQKLDFLQGARVCMQAFSEMVKNYACAARKKGEETQNAELLMAADIADKLAFSKPDTFREALQLVWFAHISFLYEGRYAMALGRMDQYLYPYYKNDVENGVITSEEAVDLVACTLYKIAEKKLMNAPTMWGGDVVNIAIGGLKRDGSDATNELSYVILEAVKRCNIPGPNLSARMHKSTPDEFYDACLKVIGTGLGYPALMNDEATVPALADCGYDIEDCRDYSMVGCIEAFISGKQPPWADGRYNTPKYLEFALNDGRCMRDGVLYGLKTGKAEDITSMQQLLDVFVAQMEFGALETVTIFNNENDRYNRKRYCQPYLSCYCQDCINRAKDINDGGAVYPSVYGLGCMGIATVADSLAAIEKTVFIDKKLTLAQLRDILIADFEGNEELRQELLSLPKYGNNDDFVDKYAVWLLDKQYEIFSKLRTRDGGRVYIAMASNVQNISAGSVCAATPDGRRNGAPMSDAASPMHGMDRNGVTSVVLSVSKPDYTKVACGSVVNQKFTPSAFSSDEKIAKLRALIKVYFARGAQEMQINSVGRKTLIDAQEHPERYSDLVVRVSGFSAYYTYLTRDIQNDILMRTEND